MLKPLKHTKSYLKKPIIMVFHFTFTSNNRFENRSDLNLDLIHWVQPKQSFVDIFSVNGFSIKYTFKIPNPYPAITS